MVDGEKRWRSVLRNIPRLRRDVLVCHFFYGMTCTEIGDLLGVSKVRVSQFLSDGIRWIREDPALVDRIEDLTGV
jgi:RNA polymerase sigma factor (sigma-70 family)